MKDIYISLGINFGSSVFGPLVKHRFTGIDIVDDDPVAQQLDFKLGMMLHSYHEFDSHDKPFWIDAERRHADKERMLELLGQLKERIDEINDGTFEVEDRLTEEIERW